MTPETSKDVATHGSVPDPRQESIAPNLDVILARELRSLLTTKVPSTNEDVVALGARSLSEIFAQIIPSAPISQSEAQSLPSIEVGGFTAWPIFITYVGGINTPFAAHYNYEQIKDHLRTLQGPTMTATGAITEAIRNVVQHCYNSGTVYGQCVFTPAALFVKELSLGSDPASRILMAVVADEGPGILDPERMMLDGNGAPTGEDKVGMGLELKGSLLYLVKSKQGDWCLFDGTRQKNPDQYEPGSFFKRREIGKHEKIDRVASLALDAPPKGCQKIMFFAHPSATDEQVRNTRELLLSALRPLSC